MFKLGSIALLLVAATACCIPVPSEGLLTPELEVTVHDAGGAPVPGATVLLHRVIENPGPETPVARFDATTDASGVARFARATTTDRQMPLMMHGVAFHDFDLCAASPDHGSAAVRLDIDGNDPEAPARQVVLTLDPLGPDCPR